METPKKVKIRPYLVSKLKMKQHAVRKKEKGVPFINAFFLQIMVNKTKLCGGRDNDFYILMTNILLYTLKYCDEQSSKHVKAS